MKLPPKPDLGEFYVYSECIQVVTALVSSPKLRSFD